MILWVFLLNPWHKYHVSYNNYTWESIYHEHIYKDIPLDQNFGSFLDVSNQPQLSIIQIYHPLSCPHQDISCQVKVKYAFLPLQNQLCIYILFDICLSHHAFHKTWVE